MKLADFPLLLSSFENFRSWRGEANEQRGARRIKSLQQAILDLNQGLEDGEIPNKTFTDAKQSVRSIFEDGYKSFVENTPALLALKDRPHGEAVRELLDGSYGSYPEPHTLAGKMKKVAKLPQDDPAVIIGTAFLKEILPLAEAIQFLKDKTVKRQPLTEEQRRERKFTPPPATTKAQAVVQKVLEDAVNASYEQLLSNLTDEYTTYYSGFLAAQKKADTDQTLNEPKYRSSTEFESIYAPRWHCTFDLHGQKVINHRKLRVISQTTKAGYVGEDYNSEYRYLPLPNALEIIAGIAKNDADEIRAFFVVKNLKKIATILEAKGDALFDGAKVVQNTISLGGLQGEIEFSFKDGAGFRVTNSVVWVMNSYGTEFNRFPLTFHDVVLPGGAKMKSPSEKRMNTVFLGKEA